MFDIEERDIPAFLRIVPSKPNPRGLYGDIAGYIYNESYNSSHPLSFGAATFVIGALAAKMKICLIDGKLESYPHSYGLLLAPSGFGKNDPKNLATMLAIHYHFYGSGNIHSEGALARSYLQCKTLEDKTEVWVKDPGQIARGDITDEVEKLFQRISDKSEYSHGIASVMKETFTLKRHGGFHPGKYASIKNIEPITEPILPSFLGVGAIDQIKDTIRGVSELFTGGFLPRFCFFTEYREGPTAITGDDLFTGGDPLEAERRRNDIIRKIDYILQGYQKCEPNTAGGFHNLRVDCSLVRNEIVKMINFFKKIERFYEAIGHTALRFMYSRAAEKGMGYALRHAFGLGQRELELEDVEFGYAAVRWELHMAERFLSTVDQSRSDEEYTMVREVINKVAVDGKVSVGVIINRKRKCRSMWQENAKKFNGLVRQICNEIGVSIATERSKRHDS